MSLLSVLAVLGAVTAALLFLSPISTCWSIIQSASVQNYSYFTFPSILLNCVVWVFYGTQQSGSNVILLVNGGGALLGVGFVAVYLWFAAGMMRRMALGVLFVGSVIGSLAAGLGFGGVWTTPGEWFGYAGAGTMLLMYFLGPLDSVRRAIQASSAEPLSLLNMLAALANSIVWAVYGFKLKPRDLFIAIPNVIGALVALFQLSVYFHYKNAPAANAQGNGEGNGQDI